VSFDKLKIWQIFIGLLSLKVTLGIFFHLIGNLFKLNTGGPSSTTVEERIAIILVVPILESLVFQFLIQEFILKLLHSFKAKFAVSLFFSSFLFSVSHNYSLIYIFSTLMSGLIYSGLYLIIRQKANDKIDAIILTALMHILYNFFVLVVYDR
jgi:uncharacterized protein